MLEDRHASHRSHGPLPHPFNKTCWLHVPGPDLRGHDATPALRDTLEGILRDLPATNVMWVFFSTIAQCKAKGNSVN